MVFPGAVSQCRIVYQNLSTSLDIMAVICAVIGASIRVRLGCIPVGSMFLAGIEESKYLWPQK